MIQEKLLAILSTCEILLDTPEGNALGELPLFHGIAALEIFDEIETVYNTFWTAHTSRDELEKARKLSEERPFEPLWGARFVRELVLSAMGGLDTGIFHTRKEKE